VRCRTPKCPAFDEVDYIPKTPTTGLLAGLCPTCASMTYRLTKNATLATSSGDLKVTRVALHSNAYAIAPPPP
jgi:hypothetical protein